MKEANRTAVEISNFWRLSFYNDSGLGAVNPSRPVSLQANNQATTKLLGMFAENTRRPVSFHGVTE